MTSLVMACRRTQVRPAGWPWTSARTASAGCPSDVACGDHARGRTRLREFFEEQEQACVLRVASDFTLVLAPGAKVTCAEAVKRLLRARYAGGPGRRPAPGASAGTLWPDHDRLSAPSPAGPPPEDQRAGLHYCLACPKVKLLTKTRLIRAAVGCAGLTWWRISGPGRTASAWTSARPGSTPRSSVTSCSSWPPWRSAPSPPQGQGPHRACGPAAVTPGVRPRRPTWG